MRREFSLVLLLLIVLAVVSLIFPTTQRVTAQGGRAEVILARDDFSTDSGRWALSSSDTREVWLEDGALFVRDFTGDSVAASAHFDEALSDFSLEADTWLVEGDDDTWTTIYFRFAEGQYYGVQLHSSGWYKARQKVSDERSNWIDATQSDAIRTGLGEVNHLRLEAYGPQIKFYVNGVLLIEEHRGDLTTGNVTLSVSSREGDSSVVAFDNVVITVPGEPSTVQRGEAAVSFFDFSRDDGVWWTGETDNGRAWIEDGALYVLNHTPATYAEESTNNAQYTDITLDVDSWLAGGTDDNWHYFIVRDGKTGRHRFGFSADGYVSAISVIDSDEIERIPIQQSGAVRVGQGAINNVRIEAEGPIVRFYVNDVLTAEINEPRLTGGRIRLGVAALDGDYSTVAFDNVVIVDLAAPEQERSSGKGSGSSSPSSGESAGQSRSLEVDPAFEAQLAQRTALGEFTRPGDDLNGYMYLTSEEVAPGVNLIQGNVYYMSGGGRVILMLDSEQPAKLSYTLDVPKSFAAHVDDLTFSQAPTQIINPDPVVVFGITSDQAGSMITVDSARVQADGQDVQSVLNVLQGFQYERTKRFCAEANAPGNRARCFMALATNFPDHVTDGDCDQVYTAVKNVSTNASDEWYLTCRAILTRDPWECSRIEGADFQREACMTNLEKVMRDRCALLTGAAESACLAEGGITSGGAASTSSTDGSASGQTGSPLREGVYHMVGDSWGTLWEGSDAAHTDAYVSLKFCDDQQRPDYIGARDAASISQLCVRPEDEYYNHFRFVSPGVFEKPLIGDAQGFSRLTVETPTRLVYYSEGVYAGGYTSFTENVLEWYSDFE